MDAPIVAAIVFLLFNLLFIGGLFYLALRSCRKARLRFPWWSVGVTVLLILLVKLVHSERRARAVTEPPPPPPARTSSFITDEEVIQEAVRNGTLPPDAFRGTVRG